MTCSPRSRNALMILRVIYAVTQGSQPREVTGGIDPCLRYLVVVGLVPPR